MESVNIFPELIKWRKGKQGLCPITIRFDFNRSRVGNQPIDYSISPEDWDMATKRVKKSHREHELINLIIDTLTNRHRNYFLKRKAFGMPVDREIVKKYITNGGTLECFYKYAESVIQTKTLKDGKGYSSETKRCYLDEVKRMKQFSTELSFRMLNVKFLESYKLWLQNEYLKRDKKRLDQNSIWKAFKFIRMIYNEAIKAEIIPSENNPFKKFQVGAYTEDIDKIKYLEKNELEKIESLLKSKQPGLQEMTVRVGWRFLCMCVSGLRISDAMNLDDAYFNDKGDIEIVPQKTQRHGNKAQVPIISDRQRQYFQKSLSMPLPKTDAKNFRTTFNIHLKILAAAAGIKTNLTSHVGRHTMGSFLVDAGVEEQAAKSMLGVKSSKVIRTYLHLKQSKLQSEAQKLNNVF